MSVEDLTRNAVDLLPAGGLERKLALGRPLRVKLGIDVTSPDIHVGRAIPLQRMRAFQDQGHTGVFIRCDGLKKTAQFTWIDMRAPANLSAFAHT